MAKKLILSFLDIIMGADAETIKAAYEAKVRIDEQLMLREEAYRRIAEIEDKIEDIVGAKGEFIFPPPPLPVAGIAKPMESTKAATTGKGKDRVVQASKSKTDDSEDPSYENLAEDDTGEESLADDHDHPDAADSDSTESGHGKHHSRK
jgi:hypothetical protein